MKLIPTNASQRCAVRGRSFHKGFTLIEAAMVTMIIGVGVLAMMQLLAAGTMSNLQGAKLTTGLNMAKNVREAMVGLRFVDETFPANWGPESGETTPTFDDVDDFDGAVFNPPINALKKPINATDMPGWEQRVTVTTIQPEHLNSTVARPKGSEPAAKVKVEVYQHGKYVCEIEWFTFDVHQ